VSDAEQTTPLETAADVAAARQRVSAALSSLDAVVAQPKYLQFSADERSKLSEALRRARAQLTGGSADDLDVLTIALVGGTGAGKSTLINAFAGSRVAQASDQRPCTRTPTVYHPRHVEVGGLPPELAAQANFVAHDRPELSRRVIVDTPDLDSFALEHRAITVATIKAVGLILFVVTQEKYLDQAGWSVIRAEEKFAPCAVVFNRIDTAGSAEEVERLVQDVKRRFAEMGRGDVKVFRLMASQHVPDPRTGRFPPHAVADDFAALKAFVEREHDASAVRKLRSSQKRRVVQHLLGEFDGAIPAGVEQSLDAFVTESSRVAREASEQLTSDWRAGLEALDAELRPLATLRLHQRFWGPLRAWLGAADLLCIGIPRFLRRGLRLGPQSSEVAPQLFSIEACDPRAAQMRMESAGSQLQQSLFQSRLPIEPWATKGDESGTQLRDRVTRRILAIDSARTTPIASWAVHLLSGITTAAMVGLMGFGAYRLYADLAVGQYAGWQLLMTLFAALLVFCAAMHLVIMLASIRLRVGSTIASRAVDQIVTEQIDERVLRYRDNVAGELRTVRDGLSAIASAIGATPDELEVAAEEKPVESTGVAEKQADGTFSPEPPDVATELAARLKARRQAARFVARPSRP
jgi:GTPase SAR1 family protein/uncharacterized membrane protein